MTPTEIDTITTDSNFILADPDRFAQTFYTNVFDLAPGVRAMFPDDMTDQRRKLVNELGFLINAVAAFDDPDKFDAMVERTRALGRRHVGYGATAEMFEPVGAALVGALHEHVDDFDEQKQAAWVKLFGFVAATMLEGASQVGPAVSS